MRRGVALPLAMNLRSTRALWTSTFAVSLALAACSATNGTSSTSSSSDGGDADGGTSTTNDAAASKPSSPKAICASLIDCMADVAPEAVGGLVSLYGEASNCWKGTAAEEEACGKACTKSLEARPECVATARDRHYLALCTNDLGAAPFRYDAAIRYSSRTGGTMTLRMLSAAAQTFQPSVAIGAVPAITLTVKGTQASGKTSEPFVMPPAVIDPNAPSIRVTSLEVERFRLENAGFCSDMTLEISSPTTRPMEGGCVYIPLEEGATIPQLSQGAIRSCTGAIPKTP